MARLLFSLTLALLAALTVACKTTPPPDIEATVQAAVKAALPSATPNAEATIAARVQATIVALATATPTVTPTASATPLPTATPTPLPTPQPTFTSTPPPTSTATPLPTAAPTSVLIATQTPTLSQMISQISPAVVQIITPQGTGSGFIFNEDGWVLTNAHVVGDASDVTVVMGERVNLAGKVVGVEEEVDLAVIKVESREKLPTLGLGDSSKVSVGDDVTALGFPLGALLGSSMTVTKGVVSSKRESGDVDYLQTDAAINPGNSGGPLVNNGGEVVGINTLRIESVLGRSVQGIGLAIASNNVQRLLPSLMAGATVRVEPTPIPSGRTPGPSASQTPGAPSVYASEQYWYTIEVPSGWRIDSSDPDAVVIWESTVTGSTLRISVEEIDPDIYPTLDSYVKRWRPATAASWTDFRILNDGLVREGLPIKAYEFVYRFKDANGDPYNGKSQWYVLGRYHVSIIAIADKSVWDANSDVFKTLMNIQESFEPARFTSAEHGYSLSHPPDWVLNNNEEESLGYDYLANPPSEQTTLLFVEIRPDNGFTNVLDYGASLTFTNPDTVVISRQLVYPQRPNPSYRIDYTFPNDAGDTTRVAFLMTLSNGNAVRVFVAADEGDWAGLAPIVEDIFLRVAVEP